MKKILFTVFAVCTLFAASAQIEKGAILVSGASNLNFTSNNEDHGDFSELFLGVKGGYFFMDNLAVGPKIAYYKDSEADDAITTFGLFGRYYVNGKIILGAGFSSTDFGLGKESDLNLEAGYAWFLNDAVAIEPTLNYDSYGSDSQGASFGLNVAFSVYLGRGK